MLNSNICTLCQLIWEIGDYVKFIIMNYCPKGDQIIGCNI